MTGEKIVKLINQAAKGNPSEATDLVYGQVKSTTPLTISIDNRFTVGGDFLILSVLVQETSLWRGLQAGDRVLMLRVSNGNQFYVMERTVNDI